MRPHRRRSDSAVPGILQARTLEWVAISFSNAWKKSESEVAQLYPTLRDPMDCSPPGSSFHGIFQARVLEWGAIAFSDAYFSYVKIFMKNSHSKIYLYVNTWLSQSGRISGYFNRILSTILYFIKLLPEKRDREVQI